MKLKAFAHGKRIEAHEVTKFSAKYPTSTNAPVHALARYHWNTDLQRFVDEGLRTTGDADGGRKCERAASVIQG